jgi:broad specificity phosphatase PhoE
LTTELWLVRHGQTDWNLEGRYQGHANIPLNSTGLKQAESLAGELLGVVFDAIFSSDLQRASITAEIVGDRLGLKVTQDHRLREIDQGDWEGHLVADVQARYQAGAEGKNIDPTAIRPPGGETVGEVAQRVAAVADDIAHLYPQGRVLIISHGLAVATLICRFSHTPLSQVYSKIPANAHPVVVTWQIED